MNTRLPIVLDELRVASPCSAEWEEMRGDERVRFCGKCEKNVYNLSSMTRGDAETLVREKEGRLCVRFYRRADGTVLTRNCPVGLSALKRRVSRVAGAALSAALGFFAGVGLDLGFGQPAATSPHVMGTVAQQPVKKEEVELPPPVPPKDTHVMMGAVAFHPTDDGKSGRPK